ncbi:HAMP domain-containing protein [Paenibacillus sp. BK033]|uniref:cache domain-containing sensor histidine kinase n=1 Tax=Paenibacillus sp. BK033 TaxID=2512133 RepID=UPI001051DAEB|nr:histidine kinase [Paenibacillus sp. BK033]TCN01276.1 HAMP domain-containing protein [Paenibacillus sp. BK033]
MFTRLFRLLTPATFKNRILLSLLVFLLVPIAVLFLYNFRETEGLLQRNASDKSIEQLEGLKTDLVDLMSLVMKTGMLLEQDSVLRQVMQKPEQYDAINRKKIVENKFAGIENSFFLTGATVYYTLIDLKGNAYTSYTPESSLNYEEISSEDWVRELKREGGQRYIWRANDQSTEIREVKGNRMLSLFEVLRDDGLKPFAYGRFSIDYEAWFAEKTQGSSGEGAYFLLDAGGNTILQSSLEESVPPAVAASIASAGRNGESDASSSTSILNNQIMYTYSKIQELDGYLVKKVPLSLLFNEVDKQKKRSFAVYIAILILFMLMIYFISSTVTGPLKLLQRKMETTVKSNLKAKLPEQGRGEILALTRSFNSMIADINALLERLKLEERQKQFVRFQVLLGQMNPHFLLNTLNTIKSIALDKDEDDIYEICVSLGKILETTLNTEADLILLKEEIVLIESYMDIQRKRFGHGIQVRYEVEGELEYALIPKFCLQPLVENSLLHGFGQSQLEGRIDIRAASRGKQLILEVIDNGVGIEKAKERQSVRKRKSIGIQNLRESLELMFKNQPSGLQLESSEEGTRVTMNCPLLLSKPYAEEGFTDVADFNR